MFEVVVCREKIPVPYHHMEMGKNEMMKVHPQVLCDLITFRYNDKVQPHVGLLLELFDIVRAYECKSYPDVPTAYVTAVFRYIVFNPPIGSVWEGSIAKSTPKGIQIILSFFSDVFVPAVNLPDGSEFDESQEMWVWNSPEEEGMEPIQFAFAVGETVRFRVCEVKYPDTGDVLMIVIASMDSRTAGLGLKSWWMNADDDQEE